MTNSPVKTNDVPELTGQIIDIFEDFLTNKDIRLNNNDRTSAIIVGADYDWLKEQITRLLQNWQIIPERS
jgi:hypothetical protein